MRLLLPYLVLHLATAELQACTAFTVSQGGHTYIGCNEDAWSINPQVRFEQGRNGAYGSIHFGHFNGHPWRSMTDQLGMNERGLVYDGLSIQEKDVPATRDLPAMYFDALMPDILRCCATVEEAEAVLRTYDRRHLMHSMIFMADRQGHWLIVENDTLIRGAGPWNAVGNWRMGSCQDPSTIPIPRLQTGRHALQAGMGGSLTEARDVLSTMAVCRKRMGEGTLFSVLFDPAQGEAHLFFYHRFNEVSTLNMERELAKGDRTIKMASLFSARPEFDRLRGYLTPFHQPWLFWSLLTLGACAALVGAVALFSLGKVIIRPPLGASRPWLTPLVIGLSVAITLVLLGVLLFRENVFYFGAGDVAGWLVFLPWCLLALVIGLARLHPPSRTLRVLRLIWFPLVGPLLIGLAYWRLFI
ncbi:MAG: hypothetical protein ACO1NQ_13310 [Flavobacteriales bacterium]